MEQIGEKLPQYCQMHTCGAPTSYVIFQHINCADSYPKFLKDMRLELTEKFEKDINCIKNLDEKNKYMLGLMISQKVCTFCTSNNGKYCWLMRKFAALWLLYAKPEQIKKLCKSITSGCISIGRRGININFNFMNKIPDWREDQFFHPHSCSNTLDVNVHCIFMGKDIVEYKNFEIYWERDIEHEVCTTV